jgi:lambda family phage portal protein
MLRWFSSLFSRKPSPGSAVNLAPTQRSIHAVYDIAQTTRENERHWANADGASPRWANTPVVRKTIRDRARYEVLENNCYAKGIVLTLANDTIGSGPRLQLRTDDAEVNAKVEKQFAEWCDAVRLAEKLRSMRVAKAVDGETFAHFSTNAASTHPVKLDLVVSEADHFCSPWDKRYDAHISDGIEYDDAGNPTRYYRSTAHPAGDLGYVDPFRYETLPAEQVIHLFRVDRPGQLRGVSEVSTALSLFAFLRRFTLATVSAAETAANLAAVMRTNASAVSEPDDVEALDAIPMERNALLTIPKGWDVSQLRAEHPATTYEMFKRQIIQELARCINMPFNVAAGDSSSYNYASGRLDHQTYFKSILVERSHWETACIDRIFSAWLQEASLIPGYLTPELQALGRKKQIPPHEWFWDGWDHVDPLKESKSTTEDLSNGTTTRDALYAKQGLDIDREDVRAAASFGVKLEEYRQAVFNRIFAVAKNDPAADQLANQDDQPATQNAA